MGEDGGASRLISLLGMALRHRVGNWAVWILWASLGLGRAHDIITTPITFDREISRLFNARCASCHHEGGTAFSLLTYAEARPWAEAIREEVLGRTMPPWGAVKGFGDFRNDQALTPEQIELIESWTDGGVPEGDAKDLPAPPKFTGPSALEHPAGALLVSGEYQLARPFVLDGLLPKTVPEKAMLQITAELPDGSVQPLLWLDHYRPAFAHPFLLRNPLELPAGARIHGVPSGAAIFLLPPEPAEQSAKNAAPGSK